MGSNEGAAMAFNAMKAMGISDKRVKPVLKNLLRLYNRKWELIEDENYRVLIEAIFDQEMEDVDEEATKKHKEVGFHEAFPEPPSKKMCLRNQADQASSSAELLLVKQEVEEDDLPIPHRDRSAGHEPISSLLHDTEKQKPPTSPLTLPTTEAAEPSQQYIQDSAEHNPISPQPRSRDNGKDPILSSQIYSEEIVQCKTQLRAYETECTSTQINHGEKVAPHSRSTSGVCLKEPKVEPGIILLPKEKLSDSRQNNGLIRPKGDTTNDYPPLDVPIATTDPESSKGAINAGMSATTAAGAFGDVPLPQGQGSWCRKHWVCVIGCKLWSCLRYLVAWIRTWEIQSHGTPSPPSWPLNFLLRGAPTQIIHSRLKTTSMNHINIFFAVEHIIARIHFFL